MADNFEYLVALDVGSSQVTCIIARLVQVQPGAVDPETGAQKGQDSHQQIIKVESIGTAAATGIKHGVVEDMEAAVSCINQALREAESGVPNFQIKRVIASLGGSVLTSFNCSGKAAVTGNEVSDKNIREAEENARLQAKSHMQKMHLIKLFSQEWECGDVRTSKSPIGMAGQTVIAHTHAVYGSLENATNMQRCIQRCGVEIEQYFPHPNASAMAVLTDSEKQCGSVVIDIGSQTSSMAVVYEKVFRCTYVFPYGAEYYTRDVAMVCGLTSLQDAESLKIRSGHCLPEKVGPHETVNTGATTQNGMRSFPRHLIARTINTRALEHFTLYKKALEESGCMDYVNNIVLTGGGAKLPGIAQIARQVFDNKPTRIGRPRNVEPEMPRDPSNSVCLGLLCERLYRDDDVYKPKLKKKTNKILSWLDNVTRVFVGEY